MYYTLKNIYLTATINTKGAELCSLTDSEGVQYIWSADPTYWARHAPILFPFVGKINEGTYSYNDQTYTIGQHGFARDSEFTLTAQSESSLTFSLYANDFTKTLYPFNFELNVIYTLIANHLTITYQVINLDTQTIVFKLGAHPGFICPLFENERMEDYYLEFEKPEEASLMVLTPQGLFTHDEIPFVGQTIDLSPDIFVDDALVFKNLTSHSISLCSKRHKKKLTVAFENFPLLGIWSTASRSPFICIEPWVGHADFVDDSLHLSEKRDLVSLLPQAQFSCSHTLSITF